jgi:hypothetical protein
MFPITTKPDTRSHDEYLAEIDEWEHKVRKAWPRFASDFALAITGPSHIEALSKSYLEEVKIKIRLDGPVHARQRRSNPTNFDDLPSPPRPWGPESILRHSLIDPATITNIGMPYSASHSAPQIYRRFDNINIDNSASVELEVLVAELRPQDPYVSSDEFALYVPFDYDQSTVVGTWTATAKSQHELYSGEVRLEVDEVTDITEPIRDYLQSMLDDNGEDETDQ